MADKPWFGVLVNKATGEELTFYNRAEFNATFYSGGYRQKQVAESPAEQPVAPVEAKPAEQQPRRWRGRSETSDEPTVEHPAAE